jgi:hypothetical protein
VIATINFEAMADGVSPVAILSVKLTEPEGFLISPVDTVDGKVTVGPWGAIQGTVYEDANGSGTREPGELGLGGVRVRLISPGPDGLFGTGDETAEVTTTLADGSYSFSVESGHYKVFEHDPPGYVSTTPNAVLVSVGGIGQVIVDFGDLSGSLLVGHLSFQGRTPPPAPDWACPVSVTLTLEGETTPTFTFAPTTDHSGTFSITHAIPAATYDIRARDLHSLWNLRQGARVDIGVTVVDMGKLIEGDANRDGLIDVSDLGMLAAAYGPGQSYNPNVDFNNDGLVGVGDLALLAANYGREGDVPLTASALSARRD